MSSTETSLRNPTIERTSSGIADIVGQLDLQIAGCRAAIAESERQVELLRSELARLEAARETLTGPVSKVRAHTQTKAGYAQGAVPKQNAARKSQGHKGSMAYVVREFARSALRTAGRPLNRTDLLESMISEGINIDSPYPAKRIGKIMWDCDEFQHIENEGYWFANEPAPGSNSRKSYR